MLDIKEIVKVALLGGVATLLFVQINRLRQKIQQRDNISQQTVIQLSELTPLIQATPTSKQIRLLKLQPYYFQPIEEHREIKSGHKLLLEPQDAAIVRRVQSRLSKGVVWWSRKPKPTPIWFAKVYTKQGEKQYQKINGFGAILGDFFQVSREYEPIKNLGWLKRSWNYLISKTMWKRGSTINYQGFETGFIGPVVGTLHYKIDLARDIAILATCEVGNGSVTPIVTACTKNELMAFYNNQVRQKYAFVGTLLLAGIVLGRWIWSDVKKFLNAMKARRQKLSGSYFNPKDAISDDKCCIICYNNCRNVIFFDCRHMIMCNECSETYDSDQCPYCKEDIDDIKVVKGVK